MRKYMQRLNLVYLLKKEFTSMWKFMQRLNLFELCLILVAQFILYVGVVVIVSKEKAKNKQPNKIDEECCRPYPAGKMNNLTHQHMHANASKSTPPNYPSIHMQIKRVIHQSDCHPCISSYQAGLLWPPPALCTVAKKFWIVWFQFYHPDFVTGLHCCLVHVYEQKRVHARAATMHGVGIQFGYFLRPRILGV
jgi:hypothetical protein